LQFFQHPFGITLDRSPRSATGQSRDYQNKWRRF
jgi:hypothetical protein